MNWQEKILGGMKLLKEGCADKHENLDNQCKDCSFMKICRLISEDRYISYSIPKTWDLGDLDN